MKKILTISAICLLLILAGTYLFVFDPLNLKPLFFGGTATDSAAESDKNPLLSPAQEKTLETFGVNPASIPSSITPEQEACFISVLGEARVQEIKAGDSPTATEMFNAKGCI